MQKHIHLYRTTNTALASYLFTIGVPLYEEMPRICVETDITTGTQQTTWQFDAQHPDGTPTSRYAAEFEDGCVAGGNTEHPHYYAATSIDNYRLLVKAAKSDHPFVRILDKEKRVWNVPKGGRRYQALLSAGGALVPSHISTKQALAS